MSLENLHEQETAREVSEASEIDDKDVKKVTFPETEENLNQWWDDPRKPYQNKEWTTTTTTTEKQRWQPHKEKCEYERPWDFTQNKFAIRNLDSNESWIPDSEKGEIINIINHLSDSEKIVIVWCTDASPISSNDAINHNQNEFKEIYKQYIWKWWECPSLWELLLRQPDPQNTILWYRRAMQWVLSLWLNEEQMGKVKIDSKLWENKNDSNERWFDVNIDYSEHIIIEVFDYFKKICGSLDDNSLSYEPIVNNWVKTWYKYRIHEESLSTDIDGLRTQMYKDILWDPWQWDKFSWLSDEEYEAKKAAIDREISKYLDISRFLVPNYANDKKLTGVERTSHTIEKKEFYLIKLSKKLDVDQFRKVMEWGKEWLDVIWKMKLNDIKDDDWNPISVEDFVQRKNISRVANDGAGETWYHYFDNSKTSLKERRISKEDYVLLWMYFELKKEN